MIKIGRRGSLSGAITVNGRQGHAAYPHLADNPVRGLMTLVDALLAPGLRRGHQGFPADQSRDHLDRCRQSGHQRHSGKGDRRLQHPLQRHLDGRDACRRKSTTGSTGPAARKKYRAGKRTPVDFDLVWRDRPSHVFLTRDDRLIETLSGSIEAVTGRTPALSTSGGTSDARFIKDYCPVVEFGLVGKTMHMVDERVALADLETLTHIYSRFLDDWFGLGARSHAFVG